MVNFLENNKLALRTGLVTSLAIIVFKGVNILFAYHFLDLEYYVAFVAIVFLFAGYFISNKKKAYAKPVNDDNIEAQQCYASLTNRELLILRLLAEGKTNKEIADNLCVAVSTIKTHTNNIYSKIHVKNRIEARETWLSYAQKQ